MLTYEYNDKRIHFGTVTTASCGEVISVKIGRQRYYWKPKSDENYKFHSLKD